MLRETLLKGIKSYAPRLVALVFGPVILWATPFVIKAAQNWLGLELTPTQIRDYTLVAMGGIVIKVTTWLVTHYKLNKAALETPPYNLPLAPELAEGKTANVGGGTLVGSPGFTNIAGGNEVEEEGQPAELADTPKL